MFPSLLWEHIIDLHFVNTNITHSYNFWLFCVFICVQVVFYTVVSTIWLHPSLVEKFQFHTSAIFLWYSDKMLIVDSAYNCCILYCLLMLMLWKWLLCTSTTFLWCLYPFSYTVSKSFIFQNLSSRFLIKIFEHVLLVENEIWFKVHAWTSAILCDNWIISSTCVLKSVVVSVSLVCYSLFVLNSIGYDVLHSN